MKRRIIAGLGVALAVAICLILYWYFRHPSPGGIVTPPSIGKSSSGVSFAIPRLDHIVIIVEENKTAASIIGSRDAPYINSLIHDYAVATNYYAVAHPSLPNYIALTSGTTGGITNDCNPPSGQCEANVPSIADRIEASGRSWKVYAEGMPAPCTASNTGRYAVKHNPFLYYPAIRSDTQRCDSHIVSFDQLVNDETSAGTLPNYAFIVPDLCDDMHDCSVATGDNWLKHVVPQLLSSPAFTAGHALLVITWDEGTDNDNRVPALFAGPVVRTGYQSTRSYSHYSLLHTIETAWKLAPLTNNDKNAPLFTDIFK